MGAALSVLTLVWPEWIEEIFGVEPDGGNGSLEWIIALGFLAVGIGLGLLARPRPAQTAQPRHNRLTLPPRNA